MVRLTMPAVSWSLRGRFLGSTSLPSPLRGLKHRERGEPWPKATQPVWAPTLPQTLANTGQALGHSASAAVGRSGLKAGCGQGRPQALDSLPASPQLVRGAWELLALLAPLIFPCSTDKQ